MEEHQVITKDGYILGLHRIPHGKNNGTGKSRPAVLLGHCMVGSSVIWSFGPEDHSLAYILANQGATPEKNRLGDFLQPSSLAITQPFLVCVGALFQVH